MTYPPDPAAATSGHSLWAPLRIRAFRALWFAQLGSTLGIWMQSTGAQWILVQGPESTALVALVQVAMMLPLLLFAFPVLAGIEPASASPLLSFGVLLGLMIVIAARAALTGKGALYFVAVFFAIASARQDLDQCASTSWRWCLGR